MNNSKFAMTTPNYVNLYLLQCKSPYSTVPDTKFLDVFRNSWKTILSNFSLELFLLTTQQFRLIFLKKLTEGPVIKYIE